MGSRHFYVVISAYVTRYYPRQVCKDLFHVTNVGTSEYFLNKYFGWYVRDKPNLTSDANMLFDYNHLDLSSFSLLKGTHVVLLHKFYLIVVFPTIFYCLI